MSCLIVWLISGSVCSSLQTREIWILMSDEVFIWVKQSLTFGTQQHANNQPQLADIFPFFCKCQSMVNMEKMIISVQGYADFYNMSHRQYFNVHLKKRPGRRSALISGFLLSRLCYFLLSASVFLQVASYYCSTISPKCICRNCLVFTQMRTTEGSGSNCGTCTLRKGKLIERSGSEGVCERKWCFMLHALSFL